MKDYTLDAMNVSITAILAHLEDINAADTTIKSYRCGYNIFIKYLKQNSLDAVNERVIFDYIHSKTGITVDGFYGCFGDRELNLRMRPLHVLFRHLETGELCLNKRDETPAFQCPSVFQEEYAGFLQYLSDSGLSTATCKTNQMHLEKFLTFLEQQELESSELIDVSDLDKYLFSFKNNTIKYRGVILYVLRKYFKFLFEDGYTICNLSDLLPHLQIPRAGNIPHAWTKEEIRRLLEAIDREDPSGKRDYALLLLIMHTGLRFADIRNLRFKNINWNAKKISITVRKTGQPLELPLLDAAGWALIDYIKNGRPQSTSDCIFIRHRPPYNSLGSSAGINKAMGRYLLKPGIHADIKGHHGVHSLRNTLAKNMLESGASLPVISQTLGHQNINTTAIYLKIDIESLRKCALDPEEVFKG